MFKTVTESGGCDLKQLSLGFPDL